MKFVNKVRNLIPVDYKEKVKDIIYPEDIYTASGSIEPTKVLHLDDCPNLYTKEANHSFQCGDLSIYIYDNVTFWPSQSVAKKGEFTISQTYIDDKRIGILRDRSLLRKFPVERIEGYATSVDYIYSPHNYFHQFVDTLPRIWSLRHDALKGLPITLLLSRKLGEQEYRIYKALLPENVKLRYVNRFRRIKADHYIHLPFLSRDRVDYSSSTYTSAGFIPNEYLNHYRNLTYNLFDTSPENRSINIYLTRKFTSKRFIKNEGEIEQFLESKGFEIIAPEKLSMKKQIQLFSSSNIIVAQMGAALTNLLYAGRGGGLIEINSSPDIPQHFSVHAKVLEKAYVPILSEQSTIHDDIILPLEQLKRSLNELERDML